MAVVHNHSPSVVPFSVTGVPMRALFHMAAFIGDGLPNFEIRDVQKGTDLLVGTPQLGQALAQARSGKARGADARPRRRRRRREHASAPSGRSVYLEMSARMQMQALLLAGPGGRITYLDAAEVRAVRAAAGLQPRLAAVAREGAGAGEGRPRLGPPPKEPWASVSRGEARPGLNRAGATPVLNRRTAGRIFLTGLLTLLPIVATIYFMVWLLARARAVLRQAGDVADPGRVLPHRHGPGRGDRRGVRRRRC